MQELLLVNPRARRTGGRKKTRTAAQKAATRRMVAANRSRRGGSAAKRRVTRHRKTSVARYAANPIRRKRRLSGAISRVRRYRNNPIGGNIGGMATQAFQGALGGIAVNTILNYIPLPAMLKTGNMRFVAQGAVAVLLALAGRKVMPAKLASNMAVGSLTITMHDAIKEVASTMLPSVRLGGVGYYTGGYPTSVVPAQLSAPARSAGTRSMAGVNEAVGMAL